MNRLPNAEKPGSGRQMTRAESKKRESKRRKSEEATCKVLRTFFTIGGAERIEIPPRPPITTPPLLPVTMMVVLPRQSLHSVLYADPSSNQRPQLPHRRPIVMKVYVYYANKGHCTRTQHTEDWRRRDMPSRNEALLFAPRSWKAIKFHSPSERQRRGWLNLRILATVAEGNYKWSP